LGFDGFVDYIMQAVETRKSASDYTPVKTLKALGQKISAAAGKSANMEVVTTQTKLGGNGPIMAFAMSSLGVPVHYVGMTGYPKVHPVFAEFAKRASVLGIADPGETEAIECEDGKLMIGKHGTVNEVTYDNVKKRVGETTWRKLWEAARFVGMVNWTMLPHMTALWKKLQADMPERPGAPRKVIFFDLADPEKRSATDIATALKTLTKFQVQHDVTLGLNEREGTQVAKVLGIKGVGKAEKLNMDIASKIRAKLEIQTCVIHPREYAVAADANGAFAVAGPFTPNPKISTGAGDHFNAGFCIARLLGCDLSQSLQLGVATSGFYVRQAMSPSREQLVRFLQTL
jgi:sugar/nucleoside kinase (ribokinase family)